jgi:hypothetical protein
MSIKASARICINIYCKTLTGATFTLVWIGPTFVASLIDINMVILPWLVDTELNGCDKGKRLWL